MAHSLCQLGIELAQRGLIDVRTVFNLSSDTDPFDDHGDPAQGFIDALRSKSELCEGSVRLFLMEYYDAKAIVDEFRVRRDCDANGYV